MWWGCVLIDKWEYIYNLAFVSVGKILLLSTQGFIIWESVYEYGEFFDSKFERYCLELGPDWSDPMMSMLVATVGIMVVEKKQATSINDYFRKNDESMSRLERVGK